MFTVYNMHLQVTLNYINLYQLNRSIIHKYQLTIWKQLPFGESHWHERKSENEQTKSLTFAETEKRFLKFLINFLRETKEASISINLE